MYTLATSQPQRLGFGPGCAAACADELAARRIRRAVLITSPAVGAHAKPVVEGLMQRDIVVTTISEVTPDTSTAKLETILSDVRRFSPDAVVGFGGSSALYIAKLVACLHDRPEPLVDFFGAAMIPRRKATLVCIPTNFGSGAELSVQAYLSTESEFGEHSILSPWLLPDLVFVDPLHTHSLSSMQTVAAGLEAIGHCHEAVACPPQNPLMQPYAGRGLRVLSQHLPLCLNDGFDSSVRSQLALGGLFAALSHGGLANSRLQILSRRLARSTNIPRSMAAAFLVAPLLELHLENGDDALSASYENLHGFSVGEADVFFKDLITRSGLGSEREKLRFSGGDLSAAAEAAAKDPLLHKGRDDGITLGAVKEIYQKALAA